MKIILICINVILMALLAASGWSIISADGGADGLEVGKKKRTKTVQSAETAPQEAAPLLKSSEEAAKVVVAKNVFDPQRCSGAVGTRGGGSTLTLVGIYNVGETAGIIVLSKGGGQRRMGPPGMPNRGNNNTQQVVKQYFRVGDTLPNGYTLSSVEEGKANLSRGASKMTLELAKASENAPQSGGSRNNNRNPMQRMLQLMEQSVQQQQQQNQMNMMRFQQTENMMRNQQRGGTPQRGGSSNSRGRSNNR